MRSKFLSRLLIFSVLLAASSQITSQTKVDSGLLEEINRIRAIDNHSHAERVLDDGEADTEGDAISCGGLEFISPPPMRLRLDNPIYTGAWRDLFGYRSEDMSAVHTGEYLAIKKRVMKEQGDGYPVWILDKLKIDVMLANRVTMGRGLDGPRFRWFPTATRSYCRLIPLRPGRKIRTPNFSIHRKKSFSNGFSRN